MKTKASIMFGFVDVTAKQDSQLSVNDKQNFVDLNDLKKVNDTYGHAEGDEFIIQVTKGVKEHLKEGEYALRLSGDEFIIVFPNCQEAEAEQSLSSKPALVHTAS